ncbi:unnamed protein product [Staurois parvus]|uniref:Uncharacterized protein n=1 Tax=Staurois parvus TaxID=386267 RepID=A0ABN9EBX8_9NEOB|nr:unnamed protein product [Staurois parvus]
MGPPGNRDHGAPVSFPKLKKAYEKGTRGISWGPLLTPGPQAVPEFSNGQSTPGPVYLHSSAASGSVFLGTSSPTRLCSS